MVWRLTLLILTLILYSDPSSGELDLTKYQRTSLSLVPTEVILADYELLKRDFDFLTVLSNEQIDKWLQYEVGYMRKTQLIVGAANKIHKPLPTCWFKPVEEVSFQSDIHGDFSKSSQQMTISSPTMMDLIHLRDLVPVHCGNKESQGIAREIPKHGHWLKMMKRSVIMKVNKPSEIMKVNKPSEIMKNSGPYFLESKGSGSQEPRNSKLYQNGVFEVEDAIHEFYMEKIVSRIAELEAIANPDGKRLTTNTIYAVLKIKDAFLEEEEQEGEGSSSSGGKPLGLLIRKAEYRHASYLAPRDEQIFFEKTLRKYGVSGLAKTFFVRYFLPNKQTPFSNLDLFLTNFRNLFTSHQLQFCPIREDSYHSFFLDYQITSSGNMIDFGIILFNSPHKRLTKHSQIFLIADMLRFECMNFTSLTLIKSKKDCWEALKPHSIPLNSIEGNSTRFTLEKKGGFGFNYNIFWERKGVERQKYQDIFSSFSFPQIVANFPHVFRELYDLLKQDLHHWLPIL